jgi:DNA-binding transcriptional MerR regulator
MSAADKPLRSGEIARLTGVSADTIRHYEDVGILPAPPRTASGYRMYSRDAIGRVRLVQRALQLGFTLTELSEILGVRDQGGAPCRRVLDMTEEKLRSLERQIEELRRAQRYMQQLVRDWRAQLAQTAAGKKALLFESLDGKLVHRTKSPNNLKRRKQT